MKTGADDTVVFLLRSYSKKELRILYDVSEDTFCRWLKEIPEVAESGRKHLLDIVQVQAILKKKGVPGEREFE